MRACGARSRLDQHWLHYRELDGYRRIHAQRRGRFDGDTYQEIDHVRFDYRSFVLYRGTCTYHPLLLCPERYDGSLLVNSE
jgi:hypothetical protein